MDKGIHNSKKRRYGEFFTPLEFAKKSFEYIESILGKDFLASGNYRIWDSACGSGNLINSIEDKYHKYIYLSTLYGDDVDKSKSLHKNANVFQYDYLNDDVPSLFSNNTYTKLSKKLLDDLNNKKNKWLIFINPPYATSQSAGTNSKSKKKVSDTLIRKYMHDAKLGEVSRELYCQFLYRINHEFRDREVHLALFSKTNYINSNNNQKYRDKIFDYTFERGFLFSSAVFDETSKSLAFPISFAIWNMNKRMNLKEQNIVFDILDTDTKKIGEKKLNAIDKELLLNNWINRVRNTETMPPLSSAITIKEYGNDIRDKVAVGFLGSLMSCGNDIQKQNLTAILSSPQASAGSLSITKENFEKCIILFSVRRITKINWLNSSDQFKITDKEKECLNDREFILDCLIWFLFSNANQCASIRNVKYKEKIYDIENNFFPYLIEDIKKYSIKHIPILDSINNDKDMFVALYLKSKQLSKESYNVLKAGNDIYKFFFENIHTIKKDTLNKLRIEHWDLGYFQIRNALKECSDTRELFRCLKSHHKILESKIENKIAYYNFI